MPDIDDITDVTLGDCPYCSQALGTATNVIVRIIEELPEPPPTETT